MSRLAGALIAMLAFIPAAHAHVHTVFYKQLLELPQEQPGEGFPAIAVAIDGDSVIAIVDRAAGRQALLYRKSSSSGQWAFSRVLGQSTAPASQLRASVAMKNSLATFNIDGVTTIWEKVGGDWVQANVEPVDVPLIGGLAISEHRILAGAAGCAEVGVTLEKGASNIWRVSGRLPGGACRTDERDLDLNYNFALFNDNPLQDVRAYFRDSTGSWSGTGAFVLQGESANRGGPLALQKDIAVAPGSTYYRWANGLWNYAGTIVPDDYGLGSGDAERVVYRDGVLLTVEAIDINRDGFASPYAYVLNARGQFENVAIFEPLGRVHDLDISGHSVVTASIYPTDGRPWVAIYELPTPLVPPDAISNDFNAHDISGFQQSAGSSFALAGYVSNDYYRQSDDTGDASTVLTASDFSYQSARLEVRPNSFNGSGAWVGVAVRYVDADNYYYLSIDASGMQLKRRLKGVTTTLDTTGYVSPSGGWQPVFFVADGKNISVSVGDQVSLVAEDTSLTHGRVALLTHRARADFDNLYVSPTITRGLFHREYPNYGRQYTRSGGTWVEPTSRTDSLKQTSTAGLALAIAGAPVTDQWLASRITLDSYGSTQPVPWFGLLARYVDERNYYYLSVRGSNSLQIRKVVNGVTTVLAGKSFTIAPGQLHTYELRALGNELHAFVDGVRIVTALDSDLRSGRYGIATYRTAASFATFFAWQP